MKFLFFFTFLLSLCKGGIWISLGILLRNHFETVLAMILRKPLPEDLIDSYDKEKTLGIIKIIGLLFIIIGIITVVVGLFTTFTGNSMMHGNFNFKF